MIEMIFIFERDRNLPPAVIMSEIIVFNLKLVLTSQHLSITLHHEFDISNRYSTRQNSGSLRPPSPKLPGQFRDKTNIISSMMTLSSISPGLMALNLLLRDM